MKWSRRTKLLVAGCFALFVTLSISIQRWIVYPQFQALEAQDVRRNTEQLLAGVERETRSLASFIADYAEWDDAWAYVGSPDPEFIRSNFAQSGFERENFQMVWIIRADGAVLYRACFDPAQRRLEEVTAAAGERILEGHSFLRPLTGESVSGIMVTAQGAALVAAHPILTTKGGGPPRGVLVMGRLMGPAFAGKLSEQMRLPVELRPVQNRTARLKPNVPVHRRLASGEMETTILWKDWFGQPALVLSMRSPPNITAVGRRALVQSVLAVLGQGMLFLIIGGLVARRSIQRSQKAEIARQLEERTAALRETEQYLQAIMNTVPAAIVIVDAARHTILDANPAALALINASREDVVGQRCHTFICPAEEGRCPITEEGKVCDRAERQLLRRDGVVIPVLKTVVSTHLRGQDCLLECFVDIRDQKAADEKIRQTVEDLGRMNRAMIGREERILELKREVNALLHELGRGAGYRDDGNLARAGGVTS